MSHGTSGCCGAEPGKILFSSLPFSPLLLLLSGAIAPDIWVYLHVGGWVEAAESILTRELLSSAFAILASPEATGSGAGAELSSSLSPRPHLRGQGPVCSLSPSSGSPSKAQPRCCPPAQQGTFVLLGMWVWVGADGSTHIPCLGLPRDCPAQLPPGTHLWHFRKVITG